MNNYKFSKLKKLFLTALSAIFMCCVVAAYGIWGSQSANALSSVPSDATAGIIYDFEEDCYSATQLDELSRRVLNALPNGSTYGNNLHDLINYTQTVAGADGSPLNNGNIITVGYGRYRFSPTSNDFRVLYWMPVYVSTTRSGDAVLTLYLAASLGAGSTMSGSEANYFSNMGYYSTNASHTAPANMYGMSYMRAHWLGNGGEYTRHVKADDNTTGSATIPDSIKENNINKYNDFIRYSEPVDKNDENFITGAPEGIFYDDIVTPSEMEWQEDESATVWLANTDYGAYNWPNDAYGLPSGGSYYQPESLSPPNSNPINNAFDYATLDKKNYDAWKGDKVWLPSITEVGTGVDTQGRPNGIWGLSNEQRSNTPGAGTWLRSAAVNVDKTNGYSTYTMYGTDDEGNITTYDVNEQKGIRPAIHLNLSEIVRGNKTTPRVNLPDVVYSDYCGTTQSLATIPDDQKEWYLEGKMQDLLFYMDEECQTPTRPINAGTYYVMVQLNDENTYFKGEDEDVRRKSTKFVVRKKKIYVEWEYEDEQSLKARPTAVNPVPDESGMVFYPIDEEVDNVPKIGMRYSATTGAGIMHSEEFPDRIGTYYAEAYIIDEELHNYNYELAEGAQNQSKQFDVGAKELAIPYFVANESQIELNETYKGKQFVQIANVPEKYIEIICNITTNGGATVSEAQSKLENLGVVDGVATYAVESVATYTFTIKIKDKYNDIWEGTGSDTSDRNLTFRVQKAPITVMFSNLPSSWTQATTMKFSLNVVGNYSPEETDDLRFTVQYYIVGQFTPREVSYNADERVYEITGGTLSPGDYYIYVLLANDSGYTSNYKMDTAVTQRFTIIESTPDFSEEDVTWQYRLNGEDGDTAISRLSHSTEATALELDYVQDGYYEFSLTLDEDTLREQHFVRATYSGDLYVTNAGLHCVTVVISSYDKNADFEDQIYRIYFRIKEQLFDLSDIQWDYTEPFVYSGSSYKVRLTNLPTGLTAEYMTGGSLGNTRRNAGQYRTVVTFSVSGDYADNYLTPDRNDPNSYLNTSGNFSFYKDWEIKQCEIEVEWVTDPGSSDLFFIPHLSKGDAIAAYSYEKFNGTEYEPCETITSTDTDQQYRVVATVAAAYSQNYTFTGETTYEFTVAAGKYALLTFVNVNGVKRENGESFGYTGSPYEITLGVWDSHNITISSSTVTYYPVTNGARGTALTSAPVNAGSYEADITAQLQIGTNNFNSELSYSFTIEKADIVISSLRWEYSHKGTIYSAYYDTDQHKFIDASGKEAEFAFAYDGTPHELTFKGDDEIDGFTVSSVSGNSNTVVGDYTAHVEWNYDNVNFNDPEFPSDFSWKIVKATIDFASVKWGYVDSEGVEHEFGENGAEFNLVRGEDKRADVYTVQLINLPDYLKDMFTYSTTSYTINDFGVKEGSSFAMAGEYCTTVVVEGVYEGDENTNSFAAEDFPLNIAKSMDWRILDKQLSTPKDNGSWTIFDNKTHDLLDICGIPKDELNYFKIEIVFRNNNNQIDNDFEGYNGLPYQAFDAGNYIIRFYKLSDEEGENSYIWGQVDFTVAKNVLVVSWDKNGQIPVAIVTGKYVSDRLKTCYYPVREDGSEGKEVSIDYVKLTSGAKYRARPQVTPMYTNNLRFEMAEDAEETYEFTFIQKDLPTSARPIPKPELEIAQQEYTGMPLTFAIKNWNSTYSSYLYILEGEEALTQTEVGVYHVSVAFKDGAAAFWNMSSHDNPDQDTYVLEFEITPSTKVPIAYPDFDATKQNYTGQPVSFTIKNWAELSAFVDYEVFYRGRSIGKNIPLLFTDSGVYILRFRFKEDSIGCWANDPQNPKRDYAVQLSVFDPENPNILYPQILQNSKEYTGSTITFEVSNWDGEAFAFDTLPEGVSASGNRLFAKNIGTYQVKVIITKEDSFFDDGTKECTISFAIITPTESGLPVPSFDATTKTLTGDSVVFTLSDWQLYSEFVELVCSNQNVSISGGTVTITAAGTYQITVRLKSGSKWADGTTSDKTITLTVNAQGSSGNQSGDTSTLDTPEFEKNSYEFTGRDITFRVKNWDTLSKYVDVKVYKATDLQTALSGGLTVKAVGDYVAIFTIKNGQTVTWKVQPENHSQTILFSVKKATLTLVTDENGNPKIENNKPVLKNGDGEIVDYDEFFDAKFTDPETGEVVPADKLEEGKTYNVTFEIKQDKQQEFSDSVNDSSSVQERLKETYTIVYEKPDDGIPMWVWIVVAVGAVLIIVIVIVVIVAVKKKSDGNDGYGGYDDGGYDDGGYDDGGYDDEDDYDEDDDEEYEDDEYEDEYEDDDEYDDEDGYEDEYDEEDYDDGFDDEDGDYDGFDDEDGGYNEEEY